MEMPDLTTSRRHALLQHGQTVGVVGQIPPVTYLSPGKMLGCLSTDHDFSFWFCHRGLDDDPSCLSEYMKSGRGVLHHLAVEILARSDAEQAREPAGKMTLIAESQLVGNLHKRVSLSQETLGLSDTHTLQICVRWHAHFPLKNTMQIVRTEPDQLSQLSQRDVLGKVLVEAVAHALNWPISAKLTKKDDVP
jgi:hypothetical protein